MHRPEPSAGADRGANDERCAALLVRDVPQLRRLVDERVHRQPHEVPEHDLDHRPHPGRGGPEGGAGERQLGDRRVEDPLGPEPLLQPRGDREHASRGADVLAEKDHGGIALELLGERLANRHPELELAGSVGAIRRHLGPLAPFALDANGAVLRRPLLGGIRERRGSRRLGGGLDTVSDMPLRGRDLLV